MLQKVKDDIVISSDTKMRRHKNEGKKLLMQNHVSHSLVTVHLTAEFYGKSTAG